MNFDFSQPAPDIVSALLSIGQAIKDNVPNTVSPFYIYDFVSSGGVWSGDSYGGNLNASMTELIAYIDGELVYVAAVTAHALTASKDVYIDILNNGDGTGTLVYTDNTINAASPSLAAGSIRLAIIVTGASSIAAVAQVNQGQETKLVPIISSVAMQVTDSLGNLICPRDPYMNVIGYHQLVASGSAATTEVDWTGLAMTINVPEGRKILLEAHVARGTGSVAGDWLQVKIKESSTQITDSSAIVAPTTGAISVSHASIVLTPSAGAHTYKVAYQRGGGSGNVTPVAGATEPAYIRAILL